MTIRLFLQQHNFIIAPNNDNQDFPKFVRFYEAINMAAFFNSMTGEFYGLRFASADEMAEYQSGAVDYLFIYPVKKPKPGDTTNWPGRGINVEKIPVLTVVNLHTIETTKQLQAALVSFEMMIDAELNGIKHHVGFGARVIVSDQNGRPTYIGTVVGMTATAIVVRMENGLPLKVMPHLVARLDLPYFSPGEWITEANKG